MKNKLIGLLFLSFFGALHTSEADVKKESSYFDYATSAVSWVIPSSVAEGYEQMKHIADLTRQMQGHVFAKVLQMPSTICSLLFLAGVGYSDIYATFYSTDPGVMDVWDDPMAVKDFYAENFGKLALKVGIPAATAALAFIMKKIREKEKKSAVKVASKLVFSI